MFLRLLFRFSFWIKGWKVQKDMPKGVERCVMIASPHTSNWDTPFMVRAFELMKIPLKFTLKDQWFKPPFASLFRGLGGIPIDRSPKKPGEKRLSMVDAMADLFTKYEKIAVVVTPEGTRSLRTEWKTGFYYVALKAKVPIGLGFLDYKNKFAGVGKLVYPSGDMDKDLREIMAFYKHIPPKHPEKFSVDLRYDTEK